MGFRNMDRGVVTRSQEAYVGTSEGGVQAWTFKRTGEDDRRSASAVLAVRGTTQQPDPRRE